MSRADYVTHSTLGRSTNVYHRPDCAKFLGWSVPRREQGRMDRFVSRKGPDESIVGGHEMEQRMVLTLRLENKDVKMKEVYMIRISAFQST